MPRISGAPPGRAGHGWLRRRLATAERGRAQLDRKLRVLHPERDRLQLRRDREYAEWAEACQQARVWHLRTALLSGQDGIRACTPRDVLTAEVSWTTTMGLRYPDGVQLSEPDDGDLPRPDAASGRAAAAFRLAVLAGVRAAAAEEALRRLDAEIAVTQRRVRALDRRWLPRLEEALRSLELVLEQAEQEDTARLRRAVGAGARDATRAASRGEGRSAS